ncbi:hypothetical protein [Mangrovimonas aestuarii]|uniref:hypothetical protein n=1 Tax=Mangrovimonas aestuarii TaxID=3018443 RepID=UPI0023780B90|nr:hypothetical protein [Mangrovimonas aestuarii]
MKNNESHNVTIKKLVKESGLEAAPEQFTMNVMARLEQEAVKGYVVYAPLISRKIWGVILVACFSVFVYLGFFAEPETGIFDELNFSLPDFSWLFSNVSFSKTTVYAVGLASILLLVQLYFIKEHYNKQLEQ